MPDNQNMKALILSAGFGTRLLPYTQKLPKPLFTLGGKPILELTIEKLMACGCNQIFINTHHLHDQIEHFIENKSFKADIRVIYEPVILETGGAIANLKPFLKENHFFVINSDVVSSANLTDLFDAHVKGGQTATLLVHDHAKYNKIAIDDQQYVKTFYDDNGSLAFTGIQVLSPEIYQHLPDKKVFSSIEVYEALCPLKKVKAHLGKTIFWEDIGTLEAYARTALLFSVLKTCNRSVKEAFKISVHKLAGDGSDRKWYRTVDDKARSWIVSDHGICIHNNESELQKRAFVKIGNHLFSKEIPVPKIHFHDPVSGMVVLDDLGDVHLETIVKESASDVQIFSWYKKVCNALLTFSIEGFKGFDEEWTCQTKTYSKQMILQYECRYFMEAFIQNYLNKETSFNDLINEFEFIADNALKGGCTGLMHRDLQSRNIMVKEQAIFFIDFQSARTGPIQYDLASLLIDPYVSLSDTLKDQLLEYIIDKLGVGSKNEEKFKACYRYCCLTRNLQFLGAFSFLSRVKRKKEFEKYIPDAVNSLKKNVKSIDSKKTPKLYQLVNSL